MSRTRVKFNALKDTELSTADTETSAKGVITFTDKRIRVGLGGDKKIDYMPATPDNVVTLDAIQTIPSEKTFTDTLLYSSSRTIADKSNTEVVVKKDIVEHLDGYVTKDTDEVITGNKTFNGSLLKESSITSLNDLSDNEVPNKQQLLNKLSEYVEKSGFTAPINFIGEIANFSSLPSSATKGDCYYTNQPPEKKGFWLKSDTGWLNLGTGVEINLDGFANVNTPNEFTKATVFNTSIEVRDNSGSILKADTNAVVVNKPLKALSVQVNPNALEFVTKEWFEKSTQTIQGLKTFTTPPKLLSPATIAQHAVNKTYVDTMVNAMSISQGNNVVRNRPPTETDRSYKPGVLWINTGENPEIYIRTANDWYGIHSETVINCPPYTSTSYPLPGEWGFGCGVAPVDIAGSLNMTPMEGYDDPTHENFGNYLDEQNSQMVWIPAMYICIRYDPELINTHPYYGIEIKVTFDRPSFVCMGPDEFSETAKSYYTEAQVKKDNQWYMPDCFFHGSTQLKGIFVDKADIHKVTNKNTNTTTYICPPKSIRTNSSLYTLSNITSYVSGVDNIGLRGTNNNYYMHQTLQWFLYICSLAHMQACFLNYSQKEAIERCAWLDQQPYMPRTIRDSWFKPNDPFDTSISNVYTNHQIPAFLAKLTHNGQKSGIVVGSDSGTVRITNASGFTTILQNNNKLHYALRSNKAQTKYWNTQGLGSHMWNEYYHAYTPGRKPPTNLNNILFSAFGGYIKKLPTDVRPVALFGDVNIQPPFMQKEYLGFYNIMFRTNIYYTSGVNGCCSAVGPNDERTQNFYSNAMNWRTVRFIHLKD